MGKIYFGHPVNFYNTEKEKELIEKIEERFPEYIVENPNQLHHQEGYKQWKAEKGSGMLYFFEEVLPKTEAGVFLPFEDGMFGAGVYAEAEALDKDYKPIFKISLDGLINNLNLDKSLKLSVEETRKRVYK